MKQTISKIFDIVVLTIWCVFMTIRGNYPRHYPPLDNYTFIVIILFLLNMINVYINKLYTPRKEHLLKYIISDILVVFPIIYPLVRIYLIKR